jgi:hypothetical protein
MNNAKPPKLTAKQIKEITDRIVTLRMQLLQHVETQLASRQKLKPRVLPTDKIENSKDLDPA